MSYTLAIPTGLRYARPTMEFIFAPQGLPSDYMVAGGGWLGLRPSHFYAMCCDVVAIERDLGRIEGRYGEIAMPAGILFGDADRVTGFPTQGAPMASRIEGLDFERVEGMGHMPQFVAPERIVAFIERVASRAFAGRTPPSA